jgi:predicted metal-binding protein
MCSSTRIGIIICDRYRSCAGGKCFRSLKQRDGAFSIYPPEEDVEIVGYTACGGCPGGNVESAPEELKKNGATVVHLATGLVVGYPPCPHIASFTALIKEKYGLEVVVGTHPIPQNYYLRHQKMGTWNTKAWAEFIAPTLSDEATRLAYD